MKKIIIPTVAALMLSGCTMTEIPSPAPFQDPANLVSVEALEAPAGKPFTVIAGFTDDEDTRSRIAKDGNYVKVLWTAGDSFSSLYEGSNGNNYKAYFTTSQDGVTQAAFTTSSSMIGINGYDCFYPDVNNWSTYNGEKVFGFNLPSDQTAVAGGIAEGLNRAYAHADVLTQSIGGQLRFYNTTSMLKFSLAGGIASQVKEITFSTSGTIAGSLVFHRSGDYLVELPGLSFSGTQRSSKVVLRGDFQAGVDYYITLWPREMPWFRMEFSDGAGNSVIRQSSRSVTFERSQVKDFGTIDIGNSFEVIDDGTMDPIKYKSATQGTKPVTLAVIPEGFTKEQMNTYELLAKSGIDALFNTEPYKSYANRFNVYILKVASRESGASVTDGNGNVITPVDTYFGSKWGEDTYSDMTADLDKAYQFVTENCPDIVNGIHTINEVPVLMIINDSRYGGHCFSRSDGGALAMVPFTYNGERIRWAYPDIEPVNDDPLPTPVTQSMLQEYYHSTPSGTISELGSSIGDWRNTIIHEFGGHAFGRLADEYWSNTMLTYTNSNVSGHSWPVPFGLNVGNNPTAVPWKGILLDNLANLVSRDSRYGRIGTFQGGDTYTFGRWRSEKVSCMIDNRMYFSAWQRYLIVQRIFTLSGDLASFTYSSWLSRDVPYDPIRESTSSPIMGIDAAGPLHEAGPLPPPVLIEM